jgi:hypothetical protein
MVLMVELQCKNKVWTSLPQYLKMIISAYLIPKNGYHAVFVARYLIFVIFINSKYQSLAIAHKNS